MDSILESSFGGIIFVLLLIAGLVFAAAIFARNLFGPRAPFWQSSRWLAAIFLLLLIPMWGMGIGVFWFEGLSDNLFKTAEARDNFQAIYVIVLAVLWLVVLLRALFLLIKGVRENPGDVIGVLAVFLILAAYVAADYFFKLPLFDFIDASEEAD